MFFVWFKYGFEVVVCLFFIGLFEGFDVVNDNVIGFGRGFVVVVVGFIVEGGK